MSERYDFEMPSLAAQTVRDSPDAVMKSANMTVLYRRTCPTSTPGFAMSEMFSPRVSPGEAFSGITSAMQLALAPLIAQSGMTQSALAEAIGVKKGFMSEIVSGKKSPSLDTLVRIAEALQVDIGDMFSGRAVAPRTPAPAKAQADDAILYDWGTTPEPDTPEALATALVGTVRHPATYRVAADLPWLGLRAGDILLCDLARRPQDGDIVLIGITDAAGFNARTSIRRFRGGLAICADPAEADPAVQLDRDKRAAWRATVRGMFRTGF